MTIRGKVKQAVRAILPPLLTDALRRAQQKAQGHNPREWEYVPQGWAAQKTDSKLTGWNVPSVREAYARKWPQFLESVRGPGPLGLSPEAEGTDRTDTLFHNILISFGYALALATRFQNAVSLLDWGGGIGHYYILSQALVPGLEIDYHCKDVSVLAEYGQTLFPQAHFYSDDRCLERQYDFVLASTSLHYSPDWAATLRSLAAATAGHLFITRLPITRDASSYVFVQRPYQYGYGTEYLGWCLNRAEFLNAATGAGMKLVREFVLGERPPIHNAPGPCEYRGFLFQQGESL